MKRTRKLLAVLLSLLMALSVCTAAFAADGFTVTFLDPDGTTLAPAQTVAAGAVPTIPADPVKEDCFFRGWKLPDEYRYYDFVTPLDKDTALTAVWEEGAGFFRDDFQNGFSPSWGNAADVLTLETEGGNRFARFDGDAARVLVSPVLDVSAYADTNPDYLRVVYRFRNTAGSDLKVKYRFANSDGEGVWRTDSLYSYDEAARDGWTTKRAMLFLRPEYFSYVDLQFGFFTDGNDVLDLDDVNVYWGGHDFDFDFVYDEETNEYSENAIDAHCDNDFCAFGEVLKLTINAPEKRYADDDKSPEATLDGYDAFIFYTGTNLSDEIMYFALEDESTLLSAAPTEPGFYAAGLDLWNADLGIEYPLMEVMYAVGYSLIYGQSLSAITLPGNNYAWADGVDTGAILPVGEYEFDVGLTIYYEYDNGGEMVTDSYVVTLPLPVRVLPKTLTVTAKNAEKYEGEADPALEYVFDASQLVGTDTLTGKLAREPGETAGSYAIKQGTLSAGDNYTISFTGATFTVKAKQTPPEEPTTPPEEPTTPPEEPTTNPPADPGNKGNCFDGLKRIICELKEMLCKFFTYPFRLIGAAFSDIDIDAGC